MAPLKVPHYGGMLDPWDDNDPRAIIINWVPVSSRVLEIGCGSGTIVGYLSQTKKCTVFAVEPDATMATETRARGIEVVQARIEDAVTRDTLAGLTPFDVIIFADVLEHLRDPWTVLSAVRAWLARDGAVLVSLPNIAHWTLRLHLLFGQFEYTDGFLMDRTHLRFFTRSAAREMFAACGYVIDTERVRWAPFPGDRLWRCIPRLRNAFNNFLARVLPGVYGYQFVFRLHTREEK